MKFTLLFIAQFRTCTCAQANFHSHCVSFDSLPISLRARARPCLVCVCAAQRKINSIISVLSYLFVQMIYAFEIMIINRVWMYDDAAFGISAIFGMGVCQKVAAASTSRLFVTHSAISRWFLCKFVRAAGVWTFRDLSLNNKKQQTINLCVKFVSVVARVHFPVCIIMYACVDISPTYFSSLPSICQNKVAQRVQCAFVSTR